MNGEWAVIDGFDGKFQVNKSGEILNTKTGKVTKGSKDSTQYRKVNLWHNGVNRIFLVHRLVANAFVPNPYGKKEVHHKDGDKENNCADNLEWVSHKEHGGKMTIEQKKQLRETYQRNLKKRKDIAKINCL